MSAHAAHPSVTATAQTGGRNWGTLFLIIGLVFLGITAVGLFLGVSSDDSRPFLSWLLGASFWLSILIGSLVLIMLSYIFDAGWMIILRRQLEHVVSGFKWLFLILAPLFVLALFADKVGGIAWVWTEASNLIPGGEAVGHDPLYVAKSSYLDVLFFVIRFVIYFAVWVGLSAILRKHSFSMDRTGDVRHYNASYRWSAFGVLATALALTFASIDWFKTLEYHWFSTMYGVWFFAASMRASIAALLILAFLAGSRGQLRGGLYQDKPGHGQHSYLLACLLLAFTVFWAYISFSQYFLQYSANIPEETFWYNIREFSYVDGEQVKNSWWYVSMFLIFAHFAFPFLYLLWYKNKFGVRIVFIAAWVLVFHLLDLYWNILPQKLYDPELGYTVRQFVPALWDITMLIGVGGICAWSYLSSAARQRALPIRDPRIAESLGGHG